MFPVESPPDAVSPPAHEYSLRSQNKPAAPAAHQKKEKSKYRKESMKTNFHSSPTPPPERKAHRYSLRSQGSISAKTNMLVNEKHQPFTAAAQQTIQQRQELGESVDPMNSKGFRGPTADSPHDPTNAKRHCARDLRFLDSERGMKTVVEVKNREIHINTLPLNVLLDIFSLCSSLELYGSVRCVCRHWWELCNDRDVWRKKEMKTTARMKHVKHLTPVLSFTKHLTKLNLMESRGLTVAKLEEALQATKLENLQAVVFQKKVKVTRSLFETMGKHCPKIRSVAFHAGNFENMSESDCKEAFRELAIEELILCRTNVRVDCMKALLDVLKNVHVELIFESGVMTNKTINYITMLMFYLHRSSLCVRVAGQETILRNLLQLERHKRYTLLVRLEAIVIEGSFSYALTTALLQKVAECYKIEMIDRVVIDMCALSDEGLELVGTHCKGLRTLIMQALISEYTSDGKQLGVTRAGLARLVEKQSASLRQVFIIDCPGISQEDVEVLGINYPLTNFVFQDNIPACDLVFNGVIKYQDCSCHRSSYFFGGQRSGASIVLDSVTHGLWH